VYADIRGSSVGEGASSTMSENGLQTYSVAYLYYWAHVAAGCYSHTVIGCVQNQHIRSFDQCAECDLLRIKFVQNQIRAK